MINNKLLVFFVLIISHVHHSHAQKIIDIHWKSDIDQSVKNNLKLDYINNNEGIKFTFLSSEANNFKLSDTNLEPLRNNEAQALKTAPSTLNFQVKNTKAGNKRKTLIQINAVVKRNNQFFKLKSFQIQRIQETDNKSNISMSSVDGITDSAFGQGSWYKFYVEKNGVYEIDSGFLNALGINTSNIQPERIKILSHGGKMLPLLNEENEYYDPPEIPIQILGGGDNSFDPGDKIRFYATATEGEYDQENDTHLNLYANRAYYYINVNASDNGKRILSFSQASGEPSEIVDKFTDAAYYEVDKVSPSLVGRRWYGDRFDLETERSYGFNFPNLITTDPIKVRVKAAAIATNETNMEVSLNNELADSFTMPATGDDMPSTTGSTIIQNTVNQDSIKLKLKYNKNGNPSANAFLNYIRIEAKRGLKYADDQLIFSYQKDNPLNEIIEFNISNASSVDQVWDISAWTSVSSFTNSQQNSNLSFSLNLSDQPKKFIAFNNDELLRPRFEGGDKKISNTNLKGNIFQNAQGQIEPVDYLVVTRESYAQPAKRLADFRAQQDNLNTRVVFLKDIYQEFNSGKPDIGAIRNFVKYIYDNAPNDTPIRYLTLLGDTSVDFKDRVQNNTNVIPTYQSLNSSRTDVSSFMSDDYYTMMDPGEGKMNADLMDLAVGRILANSPNTAKEMIDKIIDYEKRPSYDRYRNNFLLISDDVDESWEFSTIQQNLDDLGDEIEANKPFINVKKIHSDAYQQETSAGGDRYPEAKSDINDQIELGVAVVNYFGHGGEEGLAQERLVTQESVQNWQNQERLNIFVTVTCEFTRFDNPFRISGGELTYYNTQGGPVAMITTTRAISVGAGVSFNNEIAPFLFDYQNEGITAGEAVLRTKNNLGGNGKRIVFYLGDPAMNLPYAKPNIKLTEINGTPVEQFNDTLKGLSNVKLKGEIVNESNQRITNYNGKISATVFDKRIQRQTLANDNTTSTSGELLKMDFSVLGDGLFRGNASVENGAFSFEFILPKDTRIPVGNGKISLYALRDGILDDSTGNYSDFLVGSINENAGSDNQGPQINLFMNDETFVDGGVTGKNPFLLAQLADENGINTAGSIGHDITAILDGDEQNPINLNEYYEAAENDFTQGEVFFKLRDLEEGEHTIEFKAWDTYNNSSVARLDFKVQSNDGLKITRVLNYPNPFTDYTEFWFNHNRPMEPLEVQVQVLSVTGKVVWSHNQTLTTDGFLSRDITWDGRDDFGQRLGKGVYIYKIRVKSSVTQETKEKIEKLVIL